MPYRLKRRLSLEPAELLLLIGLLVVLYAVAYWGSTTAALRAAVSPIWPAAGIALVVVLRFGYRVWPLILALSAAAAWPGLAAENRAFSLILASSLLIGVSTAVEATLTAWAIRRFADHHYLDYAKHFLAATLLALPLGAAFGTIPYLAGSLLGGLVSATHWSEAVLIWHGMVIADLIGMVVLAPPFLYWLRTQRWGLTFWRSLELAGYVVLVTFAFILREHLDGVYLFFVAHIVIAIRMPRRWSALAVALTSVTFLWLAVEETGNLNPEDVYAFFLSELSVVLALNLTSYAIALLWQQAEQTQDHLESQVTARTRELEAANARLERLSNTDPLTGVWNRRYFEHRGQRELERADRNGTRIGLLMLDIDAFKAINDEHGHALGDRVLIALAERLAGELRPTDVLARLGGEEFAVLLPDCDPGYAREVAERLRRKVADAPVARLADGGAVNVSISIGGAVSQGPGEGASLAERLERVIRSADQKLYRAKEAGRDQVMGP